MGARKMSDAVNMYSERLGRGARCATRRSHAFLRLLLSKEGRLARGACGAACVLIATGGVDGSVAPKQLHHAGAYTAIVMRSHRTQNSMSIGR